MKGKTHDRCELNTKMFPYQKKHTRAAIFYQPKCSKVLQVSMLKLSIAETIKEARIANERKQTRRVSNGKIKNKNK